jgi:hypothetical protein
MDEYLQLLLDSLEPSFPFGDGPASGIRCPNRRCISDRGLPSAWRRRLPQPRLDECGQNSPAWPPRPPDPSLPWCGTNQSTSDWFESSERTDTYSEVIHMIV